MDHDSPILDLPPFLSGSAEIDGPLDALVDRTPSGRYITFELGGARFCIDAASIAEITSPLEFTYLPNSPAFVSGLAPFRGEAIAVINLRQLLQTGESSQALRPKCLVLRDAGIGSRIAFEVDRILEVAEGSETDFNTVADPGIVDAEFPWLDGIACGRIDPDSLYSLLNK